MIPELPQIPRPLQWAGTAAIGLVVMVWLLPFGSFPVGYDVWWNLLVAKTWAASGFPAAMPAAGWTDLAESFGSRQYLFVGLLALLGGSELDQGMVTPTLWVLVVVQVLTLAAALRWLQPHRSPLWAALLPALSTTWLFRATALRDLLLGQLFLIPLLAVVIRPPRGPWGKALPVLLAWLFTLSHGAVVLPVVLTAACCAGRWLDRHRNPTDPESAQIQSPFWPLLAVLLGCAAGVLLRPDAAAVWPILWSLNVEMPLAALTGSVTVRPQEFIPLPLGHLFQQEWPLLLGSAWVALALLTRRVSAALAVPALLLVGFALFSQRMFELAAPWVVLALACSAHRPVRWAGALLFLPALLWNAPIAQADAESLQMEAGRFLGDTLTEVGKPGDVVYVTDWGMASPLAWFTQGTGLVFTGMTDPVLMHSHDPVAHAAWEQAKLGKRGVAYTALEDFGARFLVFLDGEPFWGQGPDTLSDSTTRELEQLRFSGLPLRALREEQLIPWRLVEMVPPKAGEPR